MRFNVLTLFPEIFSTLDFGITGQARKKIFMKLIF